MARAKEKPTKTATINLRVEPAARDLIDRAAKATGKTRTDFMIEAVRREAESVLLDQRLFMLNGKDFNAFTAALDQPPEKNPQLRKLLATPAPWQQ